MVCLEHVTPSYWINTLVSTVVWFLLYRLSMYMCPSFVTKQPARMEFGSQVIAFLQEPLCYIAGFSFMYTGGVGWAYSLTMFAFTVSSGYFVFDTYLKVRYGSGIVDYSMIPHHLICIGFYLLWYNNSVQLVWYSAGLMTIEISSTALHTGYFARLYDYHQLYFVSGLCKLTIYPFTRLFFVPWLGYQMLQNRHTFDEACWLFVPFGLGALGFIFLISVFHFFVNFIGKMSRTFYLTPPAHNSECLLGGAQEDSLPQTH